MSDSPNYPPFTQAIYLFAYNYGEVVFPILAITFTAFCIWLAVRVFNRRERWATRMLATAIALPVLYVLSVGPACWISSRLQPSGTVVSTIYVPIIWVVMRGRPYWVQVAFVRYVGLGAPRGHSIDPNAGIEFH